MVQRVKDVERPQSFQRLPALVVAGPSQGKSQRRANGRLRAEGRTRHAHGLCSACSLATCFPEVVVLLKELICRCADVAVVVGVLVVAIHVVAVLLPCCALFLAGVADRCVR